MSGTRVVGPIANHKVYAATLTPPSAAELLFVSTFKIQDPESNAKDKHGYQRPPMEDRFGKIAEYFLENDHQYLITPLIVSVRLKRPADIDRFLKLFDAGKVETIREEFGDKVMSVVDGQHRFLGLVRAWERKPNFSPAIPTLLYFGLSFIDEAELFNTINVTQRKLPKALIETTRGDITQAGVTDYNQLIRQIAFSLCRESDSVWGPVDGEVQINMTGMRDPNRPVTYEGLRRSTASMFPEVLLTRLRTQDHELPVRLAKRFWLGVSKACPEAWNNDPASRTIVDPVTGDEREVAINYRLKDLVGVASLAKLGADVITSEIESGGKSHRMEELIERLTEVDWEKRDDNPWMRSQAGFAGQKELYQMLYALVYNEVRPGEE